MPSCEYCGGHYQRLGGHQPFCGAKLAHDREAHRAAGARATKEQMDGVLQRERVEHERELARARLEAALEERERSLSEREERHQREREEFLVQARLAAAVGERAGTINHFHAAVHHVGTVNNITIHFEARRSAVERFAANALPGISKYFAAHPPTAASLRQMVPALLAAAEAAGDEMKEVARVMSYRQAVPAIEEPEGATDALLEQLDDAVGSAVAAFLPPAEFEAAEADAVAAGGWLALGEPAVAPAAKGEVLQLTPAAAATTDC